MRLGTEAKGKGTITLSYPQIIKMLASIIDYKMLLNIFHKHCLQPDCDNDK